MLKKREDIFENESENGTLVDWFDKVCEKEGVVDGPFSRAQAEDLAHELGKGDSVATRGWFFNIKNREKCYDQ